MNLGILAGDPSSSLIVLPILIFFSRIIDVSLGTLRIIFVSKGMRGLAPIIGFFEVLIWLIVISQIMQNLVNPINYVAYAAGFAAGNFIGIYLESKLAMGTVILRIITQKKAKELIQYFRTEGYNITRSVAESNLGDVDIIYLPIRRKEIKNVLQMIRIFNPNAIYTISDVRMASSGAIPLFNRSSLLDLKSGRLFHFRRKGK